MSSEKERQWFTIKTRPQQEFLARANYQQQKMEVYLPLVQKLVKHARKKKLVERPFFPGYLFIHLAPDERYWETISSTRGAVGPVHFGDDIPVVPDGVIEALWALEDEHHFLQPKKILEKKLVPGSKVSVTLANHQEVEGIFHCYEGKDRAVVLLDLLNRQVRTVTSCTNLLV